MNLVATEGLDPIVKFFTDTSLLTWLVAGGLLGACTVVGVVISILVRRQARRLEQKHNFEILAILLRSASGPVILILLAAGMYSAAAVLLPEQGGATAGRSFWLSLCNATAAVAAGWFLYRMVDLVDHWVHRWAQKAPAGAERHLAPLVRKMLRSFILVLTALFIAQNVFNVQISALLAGLGIGGLAVALAAQAMLSNFFGSITIFADRPFRLRDLVKIRTFIGTVEEVGLRSTRLRTLPGNVVTIPNAVVAAEPVECLGQVSGIHTEMTISLKPQTPHQKVLRSVEALRQMLQDRKDSLLADPPPRAYLTDIRTGGLNIAISYWFNSLDLDRSNQFGHEFNMELLRRLGDEGVELA